MTTLTQTTYELPPAIPLFDSAQYLDEHNSTLNQHITSISLSKVEDACLVYEYAIDWLREQQFHENNYKAYRSELTTFLHWCFDVAKVSVASLKRKQINEYVRYCQSPPKTLIGYFNVTQFKTDKSSGERLPNCAWRPFRGKKHLGVEQPYQLTDSALKTKLAILSAFYSYLMGEEYSERNPAQIWLNHSRFADKKRYQTSQDDDNILAFTELQWSYVVTTVEGLAEQSPQEHQRSLFLIKLLYSCYLRVSDVAARAGFSPVMGQFKQDKQTGIWRFHIPSSKGGKQRNVAVSSELLSALKTYRQFLGLSECPTSNDLHPLFVRHKAAARGREAGTLNANLGIRQIREEVLSVIQLAADKAEQDGFVDDAVDMRKLTAHNIRHTGITHDINLNARPLSHVQADAGHESIDTTSQYLHTSQIERSQSAQHKPINHLAGLD